MHETEAYEPGPAGPEADFGSTYSWDITCRHLQKNTQLFTTISELRGAPDIVDAITGILALLSDLSPPAHRDAAVTLFRGGTGPFDLRGTPRGPVVSLALATIAAWYAMAPQVFDSRAELHSIFIAGIDQAEAIIGKLPQGELFADTSDDDVLDLRERVAGPDIAALTLAHRAAWTVTDLDIIGMCKQHLLIARSGPATPEQVHQLRDRILSRLKASARTPHRRVAEAQPRQPGQPVQPRRKRERK